MVGLYSGGLIFGGGFASQKWWAYIYSGGGYIFGEGGAYIRRFTICWLYFTDKSPWECNFVGQKRERGILIKTLPIKINCFP